MRPVEGGGSVFHADILTAKGPRVDNRSSPGGVTVT
jgi:hypothetical protein